MKRMNTLLIILSISILVLGYGQELLAQTSSKPLAEKGYEELIEGAKKEGKVVIWDTTKGKEKDLFKEFEKKYPFIKVEHVLMRSKDIVERLIMEDRAGKKPSVDVFDSSGQHMIEIKKHKLAMPFPWAKVFKNIPLQAVDSDNEGLAMYGLMDILVYNPKLVSSDKLPKSYEDILKPEWKGKFGQEIRAKPWVQLVASGAWNEEKGTAFIKKILEQKPSFHEGGTELAQLLIAGEFPVSTTYLDKVVFFKQKGAPIEWLPLEPVTGVFKGRVIPKGASHPHSAILYIGWLVSPEGQKALEKTQGKALPFPGLDTNESKMLEGKKLSMVGWADESAAKMAEIEDKFMNIWGIK